MADRLGMQATINSGSSQPERHQDAETIWTDGDVEVWYSAAHRVLHAVDIETGFALVTRCNVRDADHALDVARSIIGGES